MTDTYLNTEEEVTFFCGLYDKYIICAVLGVKHVRKLLCENLDRDGSINNSQMTIALLTYKNTPDRDTRKLPAKYMYGKKI